MLLSFCCVREFIHVSLCSAVVHIIFISPRKIKLFGSCVSHLLPYSCVLYPFPVIHGQPFQPLSNRVHLRPNHFQIFHSWHCCFAFVISISRQCLPFRSSSNVTVFNMDPMTSPWSVWPWLVAVQGWHTTMSDTNFLLSKVPDAFRTYRCQTLHHGLALASAGLQQECMFSLSKIL